MVTVLAIPGEGVGKGMRVHEGGLGFKKVFTKVLCSRLQKGGQEILAEEEQ